MYMKYIKEIFFKWKLLMSKENFLYDAHYDLRFIKKFKSKELNADTRELRAKLAEQNGLKREGKEYDQALIDKLADEISAAEAVKAEYEKLETIVEELNKYISIL